MQVCTGSTGHAEVVQLEFENDVILLRSIFEVFFSAHDPTTLNRQGADVGTQYRSVIFYHLDNQKDEAENIIRELDGSKAWSDPIVTEVLPFPGFYPAEEYHKNYYSQNTTQNYCQIVISPKISKVREKFKNILKRS
jgi:peptide-methionine (S)-S-oxide reductase